MPIWKFNFIKLTFYVIIGIIICFLAITRFNNYILSIALAFTFLGAALILIKFRKKIIIRKDKEWYQIISKDELFYGIYFYIGLPLEIILFISNVTDSLKGIL